MKYQQWKIAQRSQQVCREMERQGVPLLVAATLCARGLTDLDEAKALLSSAEDQLCDPYLMKDMDLATARIGRALRNKESIAVYGDYDVDGITATCLLTHYLRSQGGNVRYYIPDRLTEGYGVNNQAVEELALQGVTLIITVDCGITALAETAYAASLGVDMIVTDHHECKEKLPDAIAVVDPHRKDCPYPFKDLAGVGVALKLVMALGSVSGGEKRANALFHEYADLAAVGTIADVMKLLGENRTIVRVGLKHLKKTRRRGLYALMVEAGTLSRAINSTTVGYCLSPRINAAGRMGRAAMAADLILTDDTERAEYLAHELCELNRQRQGVELDIFNNCLSRLAGGGTYDCLVLADHTWHQGVVGIVASRLAEQFACPVFMICLQEDGKGKGSCRSYGGFNLFAALEQCADLLEGYGGHALAAGLTVSQQNIEQLRKRINAWAAKEYPVLPSPPVQLDVPVRLSELNVQEVAGLSALAPFGNSNPAPVFLLENVVLDGVYPVSMGRHSRLRLRQNDQTLYAAYFGMAPEQLPYEVGASLDVAISLAVFEGRGGPMLSGRIKDIRPAGLSNEAARCADLFEAFCAGVETTEQQRCELTPTREQTGTLYRLIRGGKVRCADLQPLFACTGAENAGKMLAGLTALTQLELIGEKEKNGVRYYQVLPVAQKQDLASAPILRRLRGE